MKKAFAYVMLAFVAVGLLLTTGCFEQTAYNVQQMKDFSEVTFVDGDCYLKTVR